MKTILLVDDDAQLIDAQARPFHRVRSQFELFTAENGHQAVQVLESRAIDLLVTDLDMPVMDGFELLTHALRLQPRASIVVLTEREGSSLEMALDTPGSTEVLHKPLAPDAIFDFARAHFARRLRGHLSGVSLSGLLQLLSLEERSCAVTIRGANKTGTIEMLDGDLTSASTGSLSGEAAVLEILGWRHPDVELVGIWTSPPRSIDSTLQQLILEAARCQDESARDPNGLTSQWLQGGEGSREIPAYELRPKQARTIQSLLQRVMMLDGALGIALVDIRPNTCLASESLRLKAAFEESAAHVTAMVKGRRRARSTADSVLERVTVHFERHIEIYMELAETPLALYLLGRRGRLSEPNAYTTLERIGGKIRDVIREPKNDVPLRPRPIETQPPGNDGDESTLEENDSIASVATRSPQ